MVEAFRRSRAASGEGEQAETPFARDRYVPECIERLDLVFEVLRSHEVVVAVLAIDPEGGGEIDRGIERRHHIFDHLLRRETEVRRLGAVHLHLDRWIVE